MANKTLPELTAAGALSGTELLLISQGGATRKVTLADLAAWIATAETIVPADLPYRGARLIRTSDLTSMTFPSIVTWQSTSFDTEGFFSGGAATRITIPAGITRVRLSAYVSLNGGAQSGTLYLGINKNNAGATTSVVTRGIPFEGLRQSVSGFVNNQARVTSDVLSVVEGDYFEVRVNNSGLTEATTLNSAGSYFSVEVVEVTGA